MNFELKTQMLRVMVKAISDDERTPQRIREEISTVAKKMSFGLTDQQIEELARLFEIQFNVRQEFGFVVKKNNSVPWWQAAVENGLTTHYSSRFHQYILQDEKAQLPATVANRTDEVTDQIIDLVGDPNLDGHWKRRGMVIGHVQSGKTLNYSSVITKAADAGYRVILLLAGITNSLRKQTQDRIDHAFIGKQSLEQNTTTEKIGAALYVDEMARHPNYLTSLERDFSKSSVLANRGVQFGTSSEPMIFISKKNVSTLRNIYEFLIDMKDTGLLSQPFLMVDDEADNASINTLLQHDKVSAINQSLRNIVSMFDRSSYLGYTATPFANIFIDPDTEDEMGNDDLFPSDFIKTLEAPTNYVGPEEVFSEHGHLRETMVITPTDYSPTLLPLKHKSDHQLDELPNSLKEAVLLFIIAKALRLWRGHHNKHCSMMVNVSRFNNVQKQTYDLINEYLVEVRNDIQSNAKLKRYPEQSVLSQLEFLFEREFKLKAQAKDLNQYPNWRDLELFKAVRFMRVTLVNMTSSDPLTFAEEPLTVIAIGGLALARGLTLEGLTVSYILRNASAYDTLMQMGRWFGYRQGYEDLCRLYIPAGSRDHYEKTTSAIAELRDELQIMQDLGKTPSEFGLKVRSHPQALAITATNKMKTAQKVDFFHGLGGATIEGHAIYKSDKENRVNRNLVLKFLSKLGNPSPRIPEIKHPEFFWDGVPKQQILDFISKFRLPPNCTEFEDNPDLGTSVFSKFVNAGGERLASWQVAIVNDVREAPKNEKGTLIPGVEFIPRPRSKGKIHGEVFSFTKSRKVGTPMYAEYGLSLSDLQNLRVNRKKNEDGKFKQISEAIYNSKRGKPLLLIYEINATLENKPVFAETAISFAIHFPDSDAFSKIKVTYAINKIAQQQELPFFDDEAGDEADELNSLQEGG